MKQLVCLAAVAMAGLLASAKTTTWQGTSGGNWNAAGNWNNGVPVSGDTVILSGTSVNDIADLTLSSLQFSGTGTALSGESLTLSAGDNALSFADRCTCTISTPLVLSAGDNTINLGTGVTVTFSGVISGEGRPCFIGNNQDNTSVQDHWNRKVAWSSVVNLTAHNTFSGGCKCVKTTLYLSEVDSLGAAGTDVDYTGCGPISFSKSGDIRYNFLTLASSPLLEFRKLPVNLYGNLSNEASQTTLTLCHCNSTATITDDTCVNIHGRIYLPKSSVQGACGSVNVNLHQPVTIDRLQGNGGCYDGANIWNFYAQQNVTTFLNNNFAGNFKCHVANAIPNALFTFSRLANGTTLDMNGYDQTARTITAGTADANYNSGSRIFTSPTPATLTLKPEEPSSTYFSLRGAASLDWSPDTALTLTLTNSIFTTTGRVKVSNGKLVLEAGCVCNAAMAVDLAASDSLDIAGGQTLTVRALTIGGVPQWPGDYSFGNGKLVVTSVEPTRFVWTGAGETTSAADAANWGGTIPVSGALHLPVFASGGSSAALAADATYAGVSFEGDVSAFTLTGSATLTLQDCGMAVAAGHEARQNVAVAFTRKNQEIAVAEGATLWTGAALSSDVAVMKTGAGTWIVETFGSLAGLSLLGLAAGDLCFAGGTSVAQTLPPLTVSDFAVIRVADGVTLKMETVPVVAAGVKLSIVTEGSGKVVSTSLRGSTLPSVILNGATLGFDATTGEGGPGAYPGTSIPARGGVIASDGGTVTIDSDGEAEGGPVRLGSAPATVGTLVQMTAADAVVDLGSSTLTAAAVVRTAGSGNLTFASGTVAAAADGLTIENRGSDGEIAVAGTLSSAKTVTKVGEGVLALSSAGTWSVPFDLLRGTVALTGSNDARLMVGKEAPDERLSFMAAANASALTLTHPTGAAGTLTVGGSTPSGTSLTVVERSGTTRIAGEGQIEANDFDIQSDVGANARLVIADGAVVRFSVSGKALHLGGTEPGAGCSEVFVSNALLTASAYSPTHKTVTDRTTLVGDVEGDARLWIQKDGVVTNSIRLGHTGHVGAMIIDSGAQVYSWGGNAKDYSNPRYTLFGYSRSETVRGLGYAEVRAGGSLMLLGATAMMPPTTALADGTLAVFGGRVETIANDSCPFLFAPGKGHSTLYVSGGAFTNRLNYPVTGTSSAERGCSVDSGTGSGVMTACKDGEIVFRNTGGVRFRRNADRANTCGTILNTNDGGLISWWKDGTTSTDLAACLDANNEPVYCPVYLNFNGGMFSTAGTQTPFVTFTDVGGRICHSISRITVFEKGGTIRASAIGEGSKVLKLTQEIDAPTGQGVVAVPWKSRVGFIAAPSVVIEGDGYGASAFALFDAASGVVTNIVVTSPGCDYTEATAVVRSASTEVARIACELSDNVGGALKLDADRAYVTAPRAWMVSEISLDKYLCLQKDNVLTNTLVTMNPGSSLGGYDDWFTGNNNTIRLRALRGTGGMIVAGKKGDAATDNTVHVRELSLDGAEGVDFGNSTLSVEGTWRLDANELVDRKEQDVPTGSYPCNVVFGSGSEIALAHPESLRKEDRKYVLFRRANDRTVTGAPKLADGTILPEGWNLRVSAQTVRLSYSGGLVLIVR